MRLIYFNILHETVNLHLNIKEMHVNIIIVISLVDMNIQQVNIISRIPT